MVSFISRRSLYRLGLAAPALAFPSSAAFAERRPRGILLLAHGTHAGSHAGHRDHAPVGPVGDDSPRGVNPWEDNVLQIANELDKTIPTEVAFGMADPQTMQAAVERLEKRGISEIAAITLFVSSHSPIIGNFRYILRLQDQMGARTRVTRLERIRSNAAFTFAGAMDADPLISEILFDRAMAVAQNPAKTNLVIIAHGPNDEEDNRLWLRDMKAHAAFLKQKGFRSVEVLTHRNDAPADIKSAAKAAFRGRVEEAGRDGETVVVPLLLSRGGIEGEVESDLEGLKFKLAAPLAPHPNLQRWVEAQYRATY